MSLRDVYVVGIGRIPVVKKSETGLREMGAQVVRAAMFDAGVQFLPPFFDERAAHDYFGLVCQRAVVVD